MSMHENSVDYYTLRQLSRAQDESAEGNGHSARLRLVLAEKRLGELGLSPEEINSRLQVANDEIESYKKIEPEHF